MLSIRLIDGRSAPVKLDEIRGRGGCKPGKVPSPGVAPLRGYCQSVAYGRVRRITPHRLHFLHSLAAHGAFGEMLANLVGDFWRNALHGEFRHQLLHFTARDAPVVIFLHPRLWRKYPWQHHKTDHQRQDASHGQFGELAITTPIFLATGCLDERAGRARLPGIIFIP